MSITKDTWKIILVLVNDSGGEELLFSQIIIHHKQLNY